MAYYWPFSSHNCHTREIGVNMLVFPTDLLVYRSAIYPLWKTFKYGLGGRLGATMLDNRHAPVFIYYCLGRPSARCGPFHFHLSYDGAGVNGKKYIVFPKTTMQVLMAEKQLFFSAVLLKNDRKKN